MNDSTFKAIRKLKDNQGQYLWQPSLTAGTPDTILNLSLIHIWDTGNDKYAFRCFLRLGFIGPEYKQERKILLRNLTGSSAFKAVPQKEVADDAASE